MFRFLNEYNDIIHLYYINIITSVLDSYYLNSFIAAFLPVWPKENLFFSFVCECVCVCTLLLDHKLFTELYTWKCSICIPVSGERLLEQKAHLFYKKFTVILTLASFVFFSACPLKHFCSTQLYKRISLGFQPTTLLHSTIVKTE